MIFAVAYIFVFLLGITIGSFLNVCIWRMPREESVVKPPSHCPACGYRLQPLDLIPLVSFLYLKQRCRKCHKPISWRYFIVELITGLVFVALAWACFSQDRLWDLPFYLVFAACFIAIFLIDLEHMIIPDELVIAAGAAALLKALGETFSLGGVTPQILPGFGWHPMVEFLVGAVVGALFFVAVELLSRLLFRKEGMGGGDMKLGAAIGALLGAKSALLSFGLAVSAGTVIGVILLIRRRKKRVDYIPFGPFMVLAALLIMFFPAGIWRNMDAAWQWWMNFIAPV